MYQPKLYPVPRFHPLGLAGRSHHKSEVLVLKWPYAAHMAKERFANSHREGFKNPRWCEFTRPGYLMKNVTFPGPSVVHCRPARSWTLKVLFTSICFYISPFPLCWSCKGRIYISTYQDQPSLTATIHLARTIPQLIKLRTNMHCTMGKGKI